MKLKEYAYLTLANIILAIAIVYFILPYQITSGGMSTLYLVFNYFIPIDKAIFIGVGSVSFFILGVFCLGWDFGKKTIFSTIFFPIFIGFFERYPIELSIDPLIAGIYGGVLIGIALGLVMRIKGSTGGMDIPPLVINKFTGINISILVMFTDGITILTGAFIIGLDKALIGLLVLSIISLTLNKMLTLGAVQCKKVEVISSKYEEINREIHRKIDKGTTIIDVKGGYSITDKKMLVCIIFNQQYQQLIELVNQIDSNAFVMVSDVYDVKGEGFSYAQRLNGMSQKDMVK